MRRIPTFDMPLLFCFLVLVGLGITFIYTASYPRTITEVDGSSFGNAGKQAQFAFMGLAAMLICMYTPLTFFRRYAKTISVVTISLLIILLMVAPVLHGNKAWIKVLGFQFQPSEFAKVALILVLSSFLASRPWVVRSWKGLLTGPYAIIFIGVGLILAQDDLGTATVMAIASIVIVAIAGTRFRFWGVPLLIGLLLASAVVLSGHRAVRIEAWQHPFNEKIRETFQPRNSLIAVGSGGWFGRGFCQSRQKWGYLPGAHNDYILGIICEELGFVFTLLFLFVPYLFMIFRGFAIAHRAPDEFSALVASGCIVMISTQALVNLCVVTNLIPCMGINLPFISYGGTSLIASMMMAGLLLNVSGLRQGHKNASMTQTDAQP